MKIRDIVRPLLQEIYQPDGWKMLVCCIMLNLTNRKQVDRVRHKLFKKYPTAKDLHGIGQYAKDSWEIFQNNNMNVKPKDKVLQEYLRVEG